MTPEQVLEVLNSGALVCEVEPVAAAFGVSPWSYYDAVRKGEAPVMPIKMGRRQRYRIADVRRLLGLDAT